MTQMRQNTSVKKLNSGIQLLKFIAAVMVFNSHAFDTCPNEIIGYLHKSPFHLFFDGQVAVVIFFVVSGFFSYKEGVVTWRGYINGIWRKVCRIYPAAIITLIIAFLLCNMQRSFNDSYYTEWFGSFWNSEVSLFELLKHCTFLLPVDTHLLDPPTWYLFVEVRMFILLPLIFSILNKPDKWFFWLIVVLVTYIPRGLPFSLSHLPCFLVGALARKYLSYFQDLIYDTKGLLNCRIMIFLFAIALFCLDANNIFDIIPSHYIELVQALGATILVVSLFLFASRKWHSNLICFLGNISYEFYLIHFVVLLTLRNFNIVNPTLLVAGGGISLIMAFLLNRVTSTFSNFYFRS